MGEYEDVVRCDACFARKISSDQLVKFALHRVAPASTHGDFDHNDSLCARHAVKGATTKKLVRSVLVNHVEKFVIRHADGGDKRLMDPVDNALARDLRGVFMDVGMNEWHVSFCVIDQS